MEPGYQRSSRLDVKGENFLINSLLRPSLVARQFGIHPLCMYFYVCIKVVYLDLGLLLFYCLFVSFFLFYSPFFAFFVF
jgi:hypothetical protein